MKTLRVGLGFPKRMVFILYCIDLTSFFYNFASRSPILMIFTFLKMALKFIGSSSLFEECGSNISSIFSTQCAVGLNNLNKKVQEVSHFSNVKCS